MESLRMTQSNVYLVPRSQVDLPVSLIGMDSEARNASEIWNCAMLCLVCYPKCVFMFGGEISVNVICDALSIGHHASRVGRF